MSLTDCLERLDGNDLNEFEFRFPYLRDLVDDAICAYNIIYNIVSNNSYIKIVVDQVFADDSFQSVLLNIFKSVAFSGVLMARLYQGDSYYGKNLLSDGQTMRIYYDLNVTQYESFQRLKFESDFVIGQSEIRSEILKIDEELLTQQNYSILEVLSNHMHGIVKTKGIEPTFQKLRQTCMAVIKTTFFAELERHTPFYLR